MMVRSPGHGRHLVVGDWLFAFYLVIALIGIATVEYGPWRYGTGLLALSLLLAAWTRIVLPEEMTGMLRVRRRLVDVAALTLLGTAILLLTIVIHTPATPG
jgi:hypothetical protein